MKSEHVSNSLAHHCFTDEITGEKTSCFPAINKISPELPLYINLENSIFACCKINLMLNK